MASFWVSDPKTLTKFLIFVNFYFLYTWTITYIYFKIILIFFIKLIILKWKLLDYKISLVCFSTVISRCSLMFASAESVLIFWDICRHLIVHCPLSSYSGSLRWKKPLEEWSFFLFGGGVCGFLGHGIFWNFLILSDYRLVV